MRPTTVVGVLFDQAELRRTWTRELAERLGGVAVVPEQEPDPETVEVAVVDNPPGYTLGRFPRLRFVQSTWAGVDRLVEGAPAVPIARMVAPELTQLMSEFVLTAVLMLHRGLPAYRRDQGRRRWRPRPVVPVSSRRVGVLGYGVLGEAAARALHQVGFRVLAWARRPRSGDIPVLAGGEGFTRVLGTSDVVVNLLPLTPSTRGIIDRNALEAMPPGSALVNVARGGHIVEDDLLAVLDSGHLSDAVLDVFPIEPLPADSPLWAHPGVTVLPHVAAPSTPGDLAPHVAANIARFLSGEQPRFLVERQTSISEPPSVQRVWKSSPRGRSRRS